MAYGYRRSGTRFRRRKRPFKFSKYRRFRRSTFKRRLNQNTVYRFSRSVQRRSDITNSSSADTFNNLTFQLSDLANYSEFTNLFDAYKITGVSCRFVPAYTEAVSTTQTSVVDVGAFLYTTDYDDSTNFTTMDEAYQKQGIKIKYSARRPWTVFVRPKALFSGPGSAEFQTQSGKYSPWINCNATTAGVVHRGIKWAWRQAAAANHIDVFCTYYLKFKQVK